MPIRSIDQCFRPRDHIAFGPPGLVRRHKVAVVVQQGRGRPLQAANQQPERRQSSTAIVLDNQGRLFVNFYSSSLLCVRPAAVAGAGILTAVILTFHALAFA
jgi:hypothetical protein